VVIAVVEVVIAALVELVVAVVAVAVVVAAVHSRSPARNDGDVLHRVSDAKECGSKHNPNIFSCHLVDLTLSFHL
jgi:hypothetical protein